MVLELAYVKWTDHIFNDSFLQWQNIYFSIYNFKLTQVMKQMYNMQNVNEGLLKR